MSRSDDAQSQTGPKRLPSFLDIFRVKSFVQLIVMKKQTNRKSQLNNQTEQDIVEGRTFSRWLSSEEGLENLKLFIFINTLLCFVLVCWPQVKEALDAAYYIYLDFTTQ
ncbi:hypothetical protein D910_04928 [Dendroctonus ponderosae]|uniref:Uncharacterized protein n=1 Tax=Dendroctonus ponderosae TaxID=77166 RepID=U4U3A1_DENPD|nr:hypothetical protein D910_04928 [Dendroctonus ponderosae]